MVQEQQDGRFGQLGLLSHTSYVLHQYDQLHTERILCMNSGVTNTSLCHRWGQQETFLQLHVCPPLILWEDNAMSFLTLSCGSLLLTRVYIKAEVVGIHVDLV